MALKTQTKMAKSREYSRGEHEYISHSIAELTRVASAIVRTVGESLCEVVLHDFRDPKLGTIVHIEGDVTNRTVGGTMSQIGLGLLAEGDNVSDRLNYITRTRSGQVLKALTVMLRTPSGKVYGSFCMNIDITHLALAEASLKGLLATDNVPVLTNIQFGNDYSEVAKVLLEESIAELGLTAAPLTTEQAHTFVALLNQRGFFAIRHSVTIVADFLGVSRSSVYNYLRDSIKVDSKSREKNEDKNTAAGSNGELADR